MSIVENLNKRKFEEEEVTVKEAKKIAKVEDFEEVANMFLSKRNFFLNFTFFCFLKVFLFDK